MARKTKKTLSELKAWISGLEEFQETNWTPDAKQWKVIVKAIKDATNDKLNYDETVEIVDEFLEKNNEYSQRNIQTLQHETKVPYNTGLGDVSVDDSQGHVDQSLLANPQQPPVDGSINNLPSAEEAEEMLKQARSENEVPEAHQKHLKGQVKLHSDDGKEFL